MKFAAQGAPVALIIIAALDALNFDLPGGVQRDGAQDLAWDGKSLWHVKGHEVGSVLSEISTADGKVTRSQKLDELKRPSGMTWMDGALWIAEFDGTLWRLPVNKPVEHVNPKRARTGVETDDFINRTRVMNVSLTVASCFARSAGIFAASRPFGNAPLKDTPSLEEIPSKDGGFVFGF